MQVVSRTSWIAVVAGLVVAGVVVAGVVVAVMTVSGAMGVDAGGVDAVVPAVELASYLRSVLLLFYL